MGNGFAKRETDGRDISWHMGLLDGQDRQPDFTDEDVKEFLMAWFDFILKLREYMNG
ncbi:uncharacterized protein BCR38DRAFT_447270 [Pseudomassariella vexata]|uniref:Uncharacterized protein n=1 Tax=Pseudomassariella vexata TaxID=1141098 RepID=A0A1Y2DGQ8_9PEZI|nr:uncharacterized protein BCR38DRAFT_447270 [Pseudomassariella vexata]ORY58429.1 hypothetical protein BCR38DRAFT_447270 [Pseudomassariella vexata]